jgi:hypothetical protein
MTDSTVAELLERWRALDRQREDDMSDEERIELDHEIAAAADAYRAAAARAEPLSDPVSALST